MRKRKIPNLYSNNGGTSFRYKHPVEGTWHGLGSDEAKARVAAKRLNAILLPENDLVSGVLGNETLSQHIQWMRENILPEREYSQSTIEMYEIRFRQLEREIGGGRALDEVTVHMLSKVMEKLTPRTANQFRQVSVDVFRVAMSRGLCSDNPAEATLKRREKKSRKRLTYEQYLQIRNHGDMPQWMRNAMDVGLYSLQRRGDITQMKFSDIKDGSLYVIQEKTQKHDTAYLKINIGPELAQILRRCRDDINSPFIIHRRPEKIIKRKGMHWTQIKPEMISRHFQKVAALVMPDTPADERPTFHEVRALGIKKYKDQKLEAKKLAGHSSDKMTNNYDSGHEEIRWVEVDAHLSLA